MEFLVQYEMDGDGINEIVTKVLPATKVIELYGYSDYNGVSNLQVFDIREMGKFEKLRIKHSHNEVVDDYGHLDIYCDIISPLGEVLATASYEDH